MRTTVFIGRHRAEVASYDSTGDGQRIVLSESIDDTTEIALADIRTSSENWPMITVADLRSYIAQRETAMAKHKPIREWTLCDNCLEALPILEEAK
jgi:hypothetical protein